jgi:hypothetical protein
MSLHEILIDIDNVFYSRHLIHLLEVQKKIHSCAISLPVLLGRQPASRQTALSNLRRFIKDAPVPAIESHFNDILCQRNGAKR